MKVLAMYLPQYHSIPENDRWWGEGYTEWDAVKQAKPLYSKHYQPRIPANNNYYNLAQEDAKTWKWQAKLANKYGVYGFCIYQYWFLGKQLLEKPMEILLRHPEIPIRYTICWANETWTRTWYDLKNEILMKQEYGTEKDWKKHFQYLLPFFQDPRYIKIQNKPMLHIYHSYDIQRLKDMRALWDRLARENGFAGIYLVSGNTNGVLEKRKDLIDAYYNFEPGYSLKHQLGIAETVKYLGKTWARKQYNSLFHKEVLERTLDIRKIYQVNIRSSNSTKPVFPGTFPMWDNTPRRKHKGFVYTNASPRLFYKNLCQIKENLKEPLDFVYVNAWNEWGEGAYLEPDEINKYKFLQAIYNSNKK